jgi:hypothetical protein
MTLTSLILRGTGAPRRTRRGTAEPDASATVRVRGERLHPAMAGLQVSPVHGWHCACGRCAPQLHRPH